jgi:hypothetical protein
MGWGSTAASQLSAPLFQSPGLRVEVDRLEPQRLRELGVVALDLLEEPLGVPAAGRRARPRSQVRTTRGPSTRQAPCPCVFP